MKWLLLLLALPTPEQRMRRWLEHYLKRPVERQEVLLYQEAKAANWALAYAIRDYPKPSSLEDLLERAPLRMLRLRDAEGRVIDLAKADSPIRIRWDGESAWVEVQLGSDVYRFNKKNWEKRRPVGAYARLHKERLARRDRFAPAEPDKEVFYYCGYLNGILTTYEVQEIEGVKGPGFRSLEELEALFPVWDLGRFRNPYTGKPPRVVSLKDRQPGEVTVLPVRSRRVDGILDTVVILCWSGDRKPVDPLALSYAHEGLPEEARAWLEELNEWSQAYFQRHGGVSPEEVQDAGPEGS